MEATVRRLVHLGTILAVLAFVALAAKAQAQRGGGKGAAKALTNPVPVTDASVRRGRQVFVKSCATCHGTSGAGNGRMAPEGTKPANLTDGKWDHGSTDPEMFAVIRDGIGPKFEMDSYEGALTEQEMWHVINYIKTLSANKR